MRHRDITGISHTCPSIDAIIGQADAIRTELRAGNIISTHDVKDIQAAFDTIVDLCEELRDDNTALRDMANEQHSRAEGLLDKVDELEDELSTLRADLEYYKELVEREEAA